VLDTKEIPLDSLSVPLPPEFPVIVTGDKKNKVTNYVLEKLRTLNYKTVSIFHGKNYQKSELDCYNADLTSFDQLSTVVGEIKKDHGNISGLIHLIPLSHGKQMDNIMLPEWKKRLALEVKSLFYLTKLLAGDLTIAAKNGGGGIAAVTAMGGTFASTRNSSQMKGFFPGSGAVSGFIKAFAEECPGLNIRAIDINPDESLKIIGDQIILEFTTPANDVEVGYQSSKRLMLEIQERSLNSVDKINLTMDSSWVLLITGGARGITSTVACELAKLYKPIIILAGRMPLSERGEKDETKGVYNPKELKSILASILKNEKTKVKPIDIEQAYLKLTRQREIRSNIEKMQELGAKVRYFSVDVQDEKDFGVFIDKIYEEYGRIDGVIHGAGIIEDKLVKDKDINSFDRVFDTKADSLFILSKKIRPDMLRFFALFSSVAGRFGNSGQADYGAANEIYNKTALFLNNIWRARVVSYIWGPWESMGMVSDEVQKKFIEKGVYLIPRNLGPDLFVQELLYGKKPDVEVVFGGKNEEAKTLLPSIKEAGLPLLSVNSNFNPGHNGNIDIIRRFDEDKDIYLGDHRLDGYSVVPMAMILELMAEVVTHGLPELNLKAIKDLKVLKGIILKNGQEDIRIIATPAFRSGEKTTVNVQVKGTGDKETIYYNANAELTKEDGYGFPHSSLTINDAEPFPTPIKEAYQKWLFHGPIWHGIKKIGKIGRDGITATLRSSKPDNCLEGVPKNIPWVIDPVIIDSGLQLLILWMRANLGITPLPARFKNYFRFSAEPLKGDIQCEVRIYSNNGKGVVTANLFFILPDGNLFGMIEEIEIIGSKNLNRLTE
ncbi:MAG: SDR family NAD(P)-dependent oxidoreductase, partial [Thermodesulfobacteriota bacterium]|nr:SDR family NAD(P)-dependent oxidoreductase [Thermodesulfobacteriota bacterium]